MKQISKKIDSPTVRSWTLGLHLLTNILSRLFILWVLKLLKIEPIYCKYWGDEGFKVGVGRVVKGLRHKKGWGGGFKYWEGVSTKRVWVNISGN